MGRTSFRIAVLLFLVATVCSAVLFIGLISFMKTWVDAPPPVVVTNQPIPLVVDIVQQGDTIQTVSARCTSWTGPYPYVYLAERTLVNLDVPPDSPLREVNLGVSGGVVHRGPGCDESTGRSAQIPTDQLPGHYRVEYVIIESGWYGKGFQLPGATQEFEVVAAPSAAR